MPGAGKRPLIYHQMVLEVEQRLLGELRWKEAIDLHDRG